MVSIDPGNIRLQDAIGATSAMSLRNLPDHVCVGPMLPGSITTLDLPLRDLDSNSLGLRHFVDKVLDIEPSQVEWNHIKASVRDHAWHELAAVMQLKLRPACARHLQQDEGEGGLHQNPSPRPMNFSGAGPTRNLPEKGFQWLVEQLGGSQIRRSSLGPEVRVVKPKAPELMRQRGTS